MSWEHKGDLWSLSNSIAKEDPRQALKHIIMASNSNVNLQGGAKAKLQAKLQVSELTRSNRGQGCGNGRLGGCEGGETFVLY